MRIIFLVLIIQQVLIEIFQVHKDGFFIYFAQASNQNDIITSLLNVTTIFMMTTGVTVAKVRLLASIAVILTWAQLFFWFRLFDSLAYYVDLII